MEDDRRLAASVQRALAESGLAVDTVHDGTDGIAAIETTPYDVVVMDVMMPGLNGWQLLHQLKETPETAPIPVVLLSVLHEQTTGYVLGADKYLLKPFKKEELSSVLQQVINVKSSSFHKRTSGILKVEEDEHVGEKEEYEKDD